VERTTIKNHPKFEGRKRNPSLRGEETGLTTLSSEESHSNEKSFTVYPDDNFMRNNQLLEIAIEISVETFWTCTASNSVGKKFVLY
jgi:hypothetical protein